MTTLPNAADPAEFIPRWAKSGGSERANYTSFLSELCDLLRVPRPEPTQTDIAKNAYVFERDVFFQNFDGTTSTGRIDLYKRGCFILEAKQGTVQLEKELVLSSTPAKHKKGHGVRGTKGWDDAMTRARGQAEQYAKALPPEEGWPAFLIVVDVGHSIELFADFSRSGKTYLPFPDPKSYRILLADLADEAVRERLRAVWTDPLSLDPTRRAAKVTRELADRLAKLAKSLEASKYDAGRVAQFLMRCLFTMFAEDVELIPRDSFSELLKGLRDDVATFPDMVRSLWESMDKGQFHAGLKKRLRRFNGGLFEDCEALPLTRDQLDLLIEASQAQWRDVEPAIFGTLLERALDPHERHKLGAHYTPRAYVERLVMPTIIEPLREEWDAVRTAAFTEANRGNTSAAIETVREFHRQLCETRVLDPACGSGNFLYVALEHMKRLEGEILNALWDFGYKQREIITVDPHQFKGIEVNPRAAAIADLVLWIGYLQWHTRTRNLDDISEPIIQNFHNIECRDAVLAWDAVEEVKDENGRPVTRWDGRTMKKHQVTGEDVPDDSARVPVLKYINPRKAEWPEAEYIVGNPPFIGGWKLRQELGDGYSEALWTLYPCVPNKADYVMYWWDRAAEILEQRVCRRFGFITTNSLRQGFNRKVVSLHLDGENAIGIVFAVPDHPWVDSADGADVRISMTVAASERRDSDGELLTLIPERTGTHATTGEAFLRRTGKIQADLTIGANIDDAVPLIANRELSYAGVKLHGAGFIIEPSEVEKFLDESEVVKDYRNGRDVAQHSRKCRVIDLFGYSLSEIATRFPKAYQRVLDRVKPERDHNRDAMIRENWWLPGRARAEMRAAQKGLHRYIVTIETSKHRFFTFFSSDVVPDNVLITFALDDGVFLGILSSRIHLTWALAAGGRLGVGNDPRYQNLRCFDPFPFPAVGEAQSLAIRSIGERLDTHRKKQQAAYPELTLTGMYNVLEKLRSGEPLTAKEKVIHEQGLVSVLKQIHDDLDAAVFEAYGWPVTLTDEEILERLVALNAERAEEEKRGLIRWLRPEFQNPSGGKAVQTEMDIEPDDEDETPTKGKGKSKKTAKPLAAAAAGEKRPWPKKLAEQAQLVAQRLQTAATPLSAAEVAKSFTRAKADDVAELLETLVAMGKARELKDARYVAV
ncbi:MAG: type IIL restriction-modification enzyme MmeI [Planctomycetaceae bacterium]|nr:type IIL restriction-modification enzyme MmeI [Planctomycetaceae bacterium]